MEYDEQECRIKRDLENLTRTLTRENINPDLMFSYNRGIRSCTPPFKSAHETGHSISERLKRVPMAE